MGFFTKKKLNGLEVYGKKEKETNDNIFSYNERKNESKKSYLKQSLKSVGERLKKSSASLFPPKTPEQIEYENKFKVQTQKAHREAYLKESIKQSTAKAKSLAKKKYGNYQTDIKPKQPINIVVKGKMSKKSTEKLKKQLRSAFKKGQMKKQEYISSKPMGWKDQLNSIANVGVSSTQIHEKKENLKKEIKGDQDAFNKLMFG